MKTVIPQVLMILALIHLPSVCTGTSLLDSRLGDEFSSIDESEKCRLQQHKVLRADTDRGAEVTSFTCAKSLRKLVLTFGLSRKDVAFSYFILGDKVTWLEISERRYKSTSDGSPQFGQPLPLTSSGVFRFGAGMIVSDAAGANTLSLTDENRARKAGALLAMANAGRAALASKEATPELEAISLLTAVFDND